MGKIEIHIRTKKEFVTLEWKLRPLLFGFKDIS